MSLLAVGHKRTGACPTFEHPVLQRDGHLVRVPLVGGALAPGQARVVAQVAAVHGSGTIELTNRGNLQVRGIRGAEVADALAELRQAGLGRSDAALVTISPFAGGREHDRRAAMVETLDAALTEGPPLAPKFVVHIDDADGRTAGNRAEAVLVAAGEEWRLAIAGLGQQVTSADAATTAIVALAEACRSEGAQARVADVLAAQGAAALRSRLPLPDTAWHPIETATGQLTGPLGPAAGPGGSTTVLAAARLGRIDAEALDALAALLDRWPGSALHVTPWRSFAVVLPLGAPARDVAEVIGAVRGIGLIVDGADPAAGVIACVGAAGCWQTEADTLAEAERQIARRSAGRGVLHVTGCDKRCATRAPVAVTLLGRTDGSGFDEVPAA